MTERRLRLKRLVYQVHRWTGIAACLLMALWFVSGIVMLFVGYPKLTPWERLGRLPALPAEQCCVAVETALAASADPQAVSEIVLTTIGGHAVYRLREKHGGYLVVDAGTGLPYPPADRRRALDAAHSYVPGTAAIYLGTVAEDRWTHSRALNAHRPLHRIQMEDADRTLLYVSSSTGEVVMDAPRAQRLWNYAGAWLHWLYMFRDRPVDPGWDGIVIGLSLIGVAVSLTGTLVGIWRWRFRGRYKSGARTPYRDAYLRWHHVVGLAFAAITFTWIFSGLMSMNPAGLFDPSGSRPDLAAYRGGTPGTTRLPLPASAAIRQLRAQGFEPSEIEWRVLAGEPYLVARDGADRVRLVVVGADTPEILAQWPEDRLREAAARLLTAPVADYRRLDRYDAYYYGREPEAMMGAQERRLPVLRVRYADKGRTWAYLDLRTGDLALSQDRSQRLGRWLFNFLHSWDLPLMLDSGSLREALLVLLSLGGLLLCGTGVVIGYARLRVTLRRRTGCPRRQCGRPPYDARS